MRGERQRLVQVLEIQRRFLPRPHLDPACAQQEKDEHGDGVVIHLRPARERGVQAGAEGDADAKGNRYVHSGPAPPQIAPGATKKRRGGEKSPPARSAPDWPAASAVRRPRSWCLRPRDRPARRTSSLASCRSRRRRVATRRRAFRVAGPAPRSPKSPARRDTRLIRPARGFRTDVMRESSQRTLRTSGRIVDLGGQHAVQPAQVPLVEPHAGGTGDPLEDQRRLALVAARSAAHKPACTSGRSYMRKSTCTAGCAARGAKSRARTVVRRQSALCDRFGHRLATGAAYDLPLPVDQCEPGALPRRPAVRNENMQSRNSCRGSCHLNCVSLGWIR